MLVKLSSEAQLAGILAHEIAHVIARDSMNVMSREIGVGILLSAVTPKDASGGVLTAVDLTHQILGLRYSRGDEKTADFGGLAYMYKAGYNPYGMVETMQILAKEQKIRGIEFFSTHPNPENRVGYLAEKIRRDNFDLTELKTGKADYRRSVLDPLAE